MKTISLLLVATLLTATAFADSNSELQRDGLAKEGLAKEGLVGGTDSRPSSSRSGTSSVQSGPETNTKLPTIDSSQDAGREAERIRSGGEDIKRSTSGDSADASGRIPDSRNREISNPPNQGGSINSSNSE